MRLVRAQHLQGTDQQRHHPKLHSCHQSPQTWASDSSAKGAGKTDRIRLLTTDSSDGPTSVLTYGPTALEGGDLQNLFEYSYSYSYDSKDGKLWNGDSAAPSEVPTYAPTEGPTEVPSPLPTEIPRVAVEFTASIARYDMTGGSNDTAVAAALIEDVVGEIQAAVSDGTFETAFLAYGTAQGLDLSLLVVDVADSLAAVSKMKDTIGLDLFSFRYTEVPTNLPTLGPTTSGPTTPVPSLLPTTLVPSPLPSPVPTTPVPSPLPTPGPVPGVNVTYPGGDVHMVTEDGLESFFMVNLVEEPLAMVKVNFTSAGHVTMDPSLIEFNYKNYSAPVKVVIRAIDDHVDEGDVRGTFLTKVFMNLTSTDECEDASSRSLPCGQFVGYDGVVVAPMTVNVTDNDVAQVLVQKAFVNTSFDNYGDALTEGHDHHIIADSSYGVRLVTQPTSDVNVTTSILGADAQWSAATPAFVVFTPENWNQTVRVVITSTAATARRPVCGRQRLRCPELVGRSNTIEHTVTSADPFYNGFATPDVTVYTTVFYDPLPAPEKTKSQFTDLLNTILVTFDSNTDKAELTGSVRDLKTNLTRISRAASHADPAYIPRKSRVHPAYIPRTSRVHPRVHPRVPPTRIPRTSPRPARVRSKSDPVGRLCGGAQPHQRASRLPWRGGVVLVAGAARSQDHVRLQPNASSRRHALPARGQGPVSPRLGLAFREQSEQRGAGPEQAHCATGRAQRPGPGGSLRRPHLGRVGDPRIGWSANDLHVHDR